MSNTYISPEERIEILNAVRHEIDNILTRALRG